MSVSPQPDTLDGVDRILDAQLVALRAQTIALRARMDPFLNPEDKDGCCESDNKKPLRSALEERLHQICAAVREIRDVIEDIQTRLYVPATLSQDCPGSMDPV